MGEIRNFSPRGGFDAWKMDPTNQWMEWVPMPYFQTKLYIYPIYYFHTPCIICVGPRYVYHMFHNAELSSAEE